MSSPGTSPPVFCPDFALVPRGSHEGKRPLPFPRPINLLKFGNVNASPGSTAQPSRVVVLNLDGHLYIRDLTGNAELRWNDQPVIEAELRHGDRVRLGKIDYDVVATQCAPSGPRPSIQAKLRGGSSSHPVRTPVTLLAGSRVADIRLGGTGQGDACAMIVRVGDRFWLWNLEPASELHVNGHPTARAELTEGTVVALGGSELRFHVAAAPTAKSASKLPPTAHPPAEMTNRARTNGGKTLHEDDAKAIKRWGPLALAVAAADRPELQGGAAVQAPQVPQQPSPVEPTGARPRRRWIGIVLSLLVVVAGAAAGAVFAWQHWKR